MNYKYRRAICQIRASSHHLGIEVGRHTKPITPLEKRICCYCSSKNIDDEYHYVIDCTFNSHERNIMLSKLPPHTLQLNDEDLFIYLFSNSDDQTIREFGKFLYYSFLKRRPPDSGISSNSTLAQ